MKLYISYLLASLFTSWIIIFYYGVSAGFSNYLPICALIGSILLFAIAAPLLIYNIRFGLILGLLGCLLILPFSVIFLKGILADGIFNWGILLALPLILILFSTYITAKYLLSRNVVLAGIPTGASVKILLAVIPLILFVLYLLFYGKYWSLGMFKV